MKTRSQTSSSVPMMSQSVVETGQKQSTVSSSRKRQCRASDKEAKPVAKKRIKGKQGGLKNFVTLPVDLFAQIAGLLDPGDLVVLARTNKFFRNMLMSRSATLIWRQSFENIPDLPGCPSDMPEPQYAALVFSPYCTFCGKPVRRGVDTCLRVRICSSCLQKHATKTSSIKWSTVRLIPHSNKDDVGGTWSLRSDVASVDGKMSELMASSDEKALKRWKVEREEYVQCRKTHSAALRNYLNSNKAEKEGQLGCLREAHESEIVSRLRSLGWTNPGDMDFHDSPDAKAWAALVYQPKTITERVWETMRPKLVLLLDKNRKRRLKRERASRFHGICFKITDLICEPLASIKKSLQVGQPNELDTPPPSVSLPKPLPQEIDIGRWEVAQRLADTEFSGEDTSKMVLKHDEEIRRAVQTWQRTTEQYFASLVRQEYMDTQVPKPQIVQDLLDESFHKLSDDAAILLRADAFFRTGSGPTNYAYSYGNALEIPRPEKDKRFSSLYAQLTTFRLHSRALKTAQAMLQEMGRPNASFLEFFEIDRFSCGRCMDFPPTSWENMVNHYLLEETRWEKRKADFAKVEIAYNHTHVLTPQDGPLIRLLTHAEAATLRHEMPKWYEKTQQCTLCDWAGVRYVSTRKYVIIHIQDVHRIEQSDAQRYIRAKNTYFKESDAPSPDEAYIVW